MTKPRAPPSPPSPIEPRTSQVRLASSTSRASHLLCSECGTLHPWSARTACDHCFGPLQVGYDLGGLVGSRPEPQLQGRPAGVWRYLELLPPVSPALAARTDPGPSRLRPATALGEAWGLDDLWIKDETALPTGSFKDRPASVAVALARELGYPAVGCASTGNLAAATARVAALLRFPCAVIVPTGLPESKLLPAQALGARVVEVDGTYDDANRLANLLAEEERIGLVNVSLRPFYTEGSKTLVLETLEQLGWDAPDWIGVPLGSGALLSATARGLAQARELGWLDGSGGGASALIGSQPQGCTPIVDAFHSSSGEIQPVRSPDTIAESLAIGDPASGYEALRAIRGSHGWADAPTSAEVREAILDLARTEGIWVEPAGGTVLASIRRARQEGRLDRSDRVVAFLTGAGWKTPRVLGPPSAWALPPLRVAPKTRGLSKLLGLTATDARFSEPSRPPPSAGAAREVRAW